MPALNAILHMDWPCAFTISVSILGVAICTAITIDNILRYLNNK